ncbi:MAG: hypothetical protein HY865_20520 [Chloroflexi bacterium]|nr:hypothetical protein [Chloroflexota bacterium]
MNDKNPMSREEEMLKSIAQQVNPSPSFTNELEKKLMNAHKPEKTGFFSVRKIASTAGWTVALAALIVTFIWVIRSIAPQPQPQPAAGGTPFPVGETAVPRPQSQSTPEGTTYDTSVGQFVMTVDFPEGASQATLYQLDPAQENADFQVRTIRDLAAKIGINGSLYQMQERYGGPGYIFTDGKQRIEVMGYSPHYFSYYTDYTTYPLIVNQGNVLQPDEMIAKAEEFLKARELLDFPYQVSLSSNDANTRTVIFEPRLNNLPDSHTFENFMNLQVSFDQNGEAVMTGINIQPWHPIGNYPLISAQQAWDRFLTNELNGLGVEMSSGGSMPSPKGSTFKLWRRDIPLDQPTSIIGMVASSEAVDGSAPLLIMDNISLTGNLEGLTDPEETVQLDGRFIMDGDARKFQVDSWQPSDPMPTLDGTIEQTDGQGWLVTNDGGRLQLEDLPEDIQAGERTSVYGIVSGDKLDWRTINQGEGFGGGAGLARLNLSGTPMPTATPYPVSTPVDYTPMIGTRFEGEQGNVDIWNLQADDGSIRSIYKLSSDSEEGFFNSFWQVTLEGPATEGLNAYYRLPVKVWGTITSVNPQGIATMQMERYEPLYPDEKAQLFLGEEKVIQAEGMDVLLFTADDGTSYVRNDSIQYGMIEPMTTAEEGFTNFIVGWSAPGKTFGGYPVLNVISMGSVPQDYDFDVVISDALMPLVMDEAQANLSGETPTGIITHVELVYQGEDQLLAEVEEGRVLYAQPFWHFSGYYSENSYFDIIIQALPDEYLQPVPLQ